MEQFVTKLGKTRAGDRTRIWIEGKRLTEHGFKVGDLFAKHWNEKHRELVLSKIHPRTTEMMKRESYGKVSGKGEKPIIDITGAKMQATFGLFESVVVTYDRGSIRIELGTAIKVGRV
ncbi:hypothetical protein HU675_0038500 [Bradyrhizobium septentrionale]|uniref:hypothetical protein n=1 Tax=Bradyrhizobium septentrionale TaxID=1404411 RepID=UPI001596C950|nr:hypothetical protein [Bradyrhizobium septentrionale]UGY23778.1 hypothetical protein HU675_0038500 [Bradyrhizobium septentrionale]